jgi:ubiquitin carboxyl-terminal hydrolase 5/13
VELPAALAAMVEPAAVDLRCDCCGRTTRFSKASSRFLSFPDTLVVTLNRFGLVAGSWVPRKLALDVRVPEVLDLSPLRAVGGLQPGETPLPDGGAGGDDDSGVDDAVVGKLFAALESMGVSRAQCEHASLAVRGSGEPAHVEAATNWIFEHMEERYSVPVPRKPKGGAAAAAAAPPAVNEEALAVLLSMGVAAPKAEAALRACNSDVERALDWAFSHMDDEGPAPAGAAGAAGPAALLPDDGRPPRYRLASFIAHRGTSAACGHYVAFVRSPKTAAAVARADGGAPAAVDDDAEWAIFNDDKVAHMPDPPISQAYVLFFRKL